jgi:hypothetical protein
METLIKTNNQRYINNFSYNDDDKINIYVSSKF